MMKQIQNSIYIINWNVSSKQACENPCNDSIKYLPIDELLNDDMDTVTLHAELKTVKFQFHIVAIADIISCKRLQ